MRTGADKINTLARLLERAGHAGTGQEEAENSIGRFRAVLAATDLTIQDLLNGIPRSTKIPAATPGYVSMETLRKDHSLLRMDFERIEIQRKRYVAEEIELEQKASEHKAERAALMKEVRAERWKRLEALIERRTGLAKNWGNLFIKTMSEMGHKRLRYNSIHEWRTVGNGVPDYAYDVVDRMPENVQINRVHSLDVKDMLVLLDLIGPTPAKRADISDLSQKLIKTGRNWNDRTIRSLTKQMDGRCPPDNFGAKDFALLASLGHADLTTVPIDLIKRQISQQTDRVYNDRLLAKAIALLSRGLQSRWL